MLAGVYGLHSHATPCKVDPKIDAISRSHLDLHLFGGHLVGQYLRLGGNTLGMWQVVTTCVPLLDPLGVFLKPTVWALALAASITSNSQRRRDGILQGYLLHHGQDFLLDVTLSPSP